MKRRAFITLLGGAAAVALWSPNAFAQSPSKRPLVACVIGGSKTVADRFFGGFSQGMRELGYAEGRDYGFEVRYADGDYNRILLLTEELLRLKPDVMVQGTMAGVIAAKKLTDSIPIVSEVLTDPVGFGLAASHARPGGNVTGVLLTVEDLPSKLLALAIETVPGANRIGLLINPVNPIQVLFRRNLEVAAGALGVELVASEVASPEDLQAALRRLGARKRQDRARASGHDVPQRAQAHRIVRDGRAAADRVWFPRECRRWRIDELWDRSARELAPHG